MLSRLNLLASPGLMVPNIEATIPYTKMARLAAKISIIIPSCSRQRLLIHVVALLPPLQDCRRGIHCCVEQQAREQQCGKPGRENEAIPWMSEPIAHRAHSQGAERGGCARKEEDHPSDGAMLRFRSEEHTSELQ